MKDVKEVVNSQAGPALENLGNSASRATGQLMSLDFEGFGESLKLVGGNIKNINFGVVKDGLSSMASGFGAIAKALFDNNFGDFYACDVDHERVEDTYNNLIAEAKVSLQERKGIDMIKELKEIDFAFIDSGNAEVRAEEFEAVVERMPPLS